MDVGAALRQAREQRGMSLEDIEKLTKIRVSILDAIETNRSDRLPQEIYVRGFVRAFAREVGLDRDDIAQQYIDQFEPPADVEEPSEQDEYERDVESPAPAAIGHEDRPLGRAWRAAALVLGVGLVVYSVARWHPWPAKHAHTPAPNPVTETHAPPVTAPAPDPPVETGTSGSSASSTPASTNGRVLHFDIRAAGLCWLSASADGARVVNQLMQEGEQHALEIKQEAVLRVGDPSAFVFSINGIAGRSLGRAGEAVTVHITNDNYREFLRH